MPPELDRITLKALAKVAEERYQSAEELMADLATARDGMLSNDSAKPEILPPPGPFYRKVLDTLSNIPLRGRLSIGASLIALGILLVASWVIWYSTHRAPSPPPQAVAWYERGTGALREGAFYQASKAFEQAVKIDDSFQLAHARLAEACMEMDYTNNAGAELLRASALSPLNQTDELYLKAIRSTFTRDYVQAINYYREIASLSPQEPQVYVDLGRAYEKTDEIKKAIESYVEAANHDPTYATAYLHLGILYGRRLELASAQAAFEKAEALYQASSNTEGRTEVFYQRGVLFNKLRKIDDARAQLEQALELTHASGNESQQINILSQLSNTYTAGDTAQAEQYAREAVNLAESKGMNNLRARSLISLGSVFLLRGNSVEAERYFKQALEFAQLFKGLATEARAQLSLGSLYAQIGETDQALQYIETALVFYQKGGYGTETYQALTLLMHINRDRGNYDAALRAFEQQLEHARQVDDLSQVKSAEEGIGSVLVLQERYPEALAHFEEYYATSKKLSDQQGIAYSFFHRGGVLWKLGRYTEARTALDQATVLAQSSGKRALLAEIYQYEAEMALSQRLFSAAIAKSQQALAMPEAQDSHTLPEVKSVLGLAQVLSGAKSQGRQMCQDAFVSAASHSSETALLSKAQLALAEAMLETGDAQSALANALQAQDSFARSGQQDSEWHALLIAALASRAAGDQAKARDYASQASQILSDLQQSLLKIGGIEASGYLARPDIKYSHRRLGELLAVN